ncbi:type II secretion system protein [Rossellomorea oryzaecorticis]|uniref:Type II secretion system protein n=1 Tax=Rossellomorea oryzaecorticis TaxID=1396505 RepID=A0ABU9KFN6_9BACI
MLKKFLKNDKGLTLVELLAVIVILGIIAAIAVPSIGGIINKSKDDAKVAEAVQIINAAKLAHASDSNVNEWDQTALDEYLSNVEDSDGFTVKYNATKKEYRLFGHHSLSLITHVATDYTTEKEILDEAK